MNKSFSRIILEILENNPEGMNSTQIFKAVEAIRPGPSESVIRGSLAKMAERDEIHRAEKQINNLTRKARFLYKFGPGANVSLKTGLTQWRKEKVSINRNTILQAIKDLGGEATSIQIGLHINLHPRGIGCTLVKMTEELHVCRFERDKGGYLFAVYKIGQGVSAKRNDYLIRLDKDGNPMSQPGRSHGKAKPEPETKTAKAVVKLPEKPRSWMDI